MIVVPVFYTDLRTRGCSDQQILCTIRQWFRATPTQDGIMSAYQITGAEAALLYLYVRRRKRQSSAALVPGCS